VFKTESEEVLTIKAALAFPVDVVVGVKRKEYQDQ
jgi:hypothetical protein